MASGFPLLPGYTPTQNIETTDFKRVSAQKQELNRESKNERIIAYPLPGQVKQQAPDQSKALNANYLSTAHDSFKPTFTGEMTEQFVPTYVKLDKHVLKFQGFFKESVSESNLENYRVRKLEVFFYLEDNSILINEPKQMNSGIPQGPFLTRQKVLKKDKKFMTAHDFLVGDEIEIFGKRVLLTDCDTYTREFYDGIGITQGNPLSTPVDNFQEKTLNKFIPKPDSMMKDFLEHQLGGGRVPSQKQFLENDRKVLRFYCESGICYIIHYYLADDSVEVREVKQANSGRDPFPLLMKRQKLPKKFNLNQPGQSVSEDFVGPMDMKPGEYITLFGRPFLILGCDPFTHEYYMEKYGYDFPIGDVTKPKPKEYPPKQIPPYNGFGDEEDSLGHINSLLPKGPKKDYFKWMDNQSYVRFLATFNTTKPEDVKREFIITFFLHDDTLLVYEQPQRNSGFAGGKFLEKGKYKNALKNHNFFTPADFLVGKDVVINGYSFHIHDCDEHTKKWFKGNYKPTE